MKKSKTGGLGKETAPEWKTRKRQFGPEEIEVIASRLQEIAKDLKATAARMRQHEIEAVAVDGWKGLHGESRGFSTFYNFSSNAEAEVSKEVGRRGISWKS